MSVGPAPLRPMLRLCTLSLVALLGLLPGSAALRAHDDDVPLETLAARASTAAELIAASRLAEERRDFDHALWFAKLAVGLAESPADVKATRMRWLEARGAAAAPEADAEALLADAAKVLYGIASACESRKLYANAADVLNTLKGTAYDAEARGKLAKLFAKPQAIEGLLESGIPVEVTRRERKSKAEIAKLDAQHADWSNPLVLEGQNYVLKTDVGYELARSILDAMDQINGFYRKVFDLGRGKKTRKCTLHVYKDRAEFDEHARPGSPGVQGYYMPMTNEVHTYDHASVPFLGREYLWSTLFHEASHQFTAEIWKLVIPTWLNEGTGSYFEGAVLQPGGFVATNRIPDSRLRELVRMIGASDGDRRRGPELEQVLSHMGPGSYDGEYYPFGWGLVYFCRNYEDERSRRVFLPVYEAFMRSYVDGKGERHPLKRFEQFFITQAKVPGVDSLAAFEALWKRWIRDLHTIQYGGAEQAEVLLARGRQQLSNGAPPEFAVDSFRWATEKDPLHATAWLELGRAAAKAGQKDAALYAQRRLAALAMRQPDADQPLAKFEGSARAAYAAALTEIKALDASIERLLREQTDRIVQAAFALAQQHIEAALPLTALSVLRDVDMLLDGDGRVRARVSELSGELGVDGRLAREVPIDPELTAWRSEDRGWRAGDDGALVLESRRGLSTIRLAEAPPKVFRFEATVTPGTSMVGILFDGQTLDESYFVIRPGRLALLVRYDADPQALMEGRSPFEVLSNVTGAVPADLGESFRMALEVEHTRLRVSIDGTLVGTYDVPCEDVRGQVGLVVEGRGATFRDVRLAY